MGVSLVVRGKGEIITIERREFHGVENAEYFTVHNMGWKEAEYFCSQLTNAIESAKKAAMNARQDALKRQRELFESAKKGI